MVILCLLPNAPALANDTAVGGIGGDVYPLSSTDIRMEAETVQVTCYREFAEYQVDFVFVNDGAPQLVKLGFPFMVTALNDPWGNAPVAFRAWQDGEPLAVTLGREVSQEDLMSADNAPGYYLHEATFPRGRTIITVSYLAEPTFSAGNRFAKLTPQAFIAMNMGGWSSWYEYWLHTGAGWKGTIGKATIRFQLADSFDGWALDVKAAERETYGEGAGAPVTRPESYVKLDDRTYQWIFEDFEPTEANDIVLAFTKAYLRHSVSHDGFPAGYGAFAFADTASERLGPNEEREAPPGFEAVDGSLETAWGFTDPGDGWIRVGIAGNQNLREIRILPGRNDAPGSFYEYGRPKTVSIRLSDHTDTTITLADEPALQRFALSGTSDGVTVAVLDIYPGTRSNDTYISEIDFGTAPAPSFEEIVALTSGQGPPATPAPTTQSTSTSTVAPTTATAPTTGRLMWPVYLGVVVALVAAMVAVVLLLKLRRR